MKPQADLPSEETLDPEDWEPIRALGHRMVDEMLDFLRTVRERPVWHPIPDETKARLRVPVPRQTSSPLWASVKSITSSPSSYSLKLVPVLTPIPPKRPYLPKPKPTPVRTSSDSILRRVANW